MNRRISIAIASLSLVVLSLAVLFYVDRFWVDKSTIYFRQKELQDGILTYVLCFNRPPENLIDVVDSYFLPKKSHLYRYPVGFHEKEPNLIEGNCLIEHHQGRIIVGYLISGELVSNPYLTNELNEQVNDILNRKIKEPAPQNPAVQKTVDFMRHANFSGSDLGLAAYDAASVAAQEAGKAGCQ